MLSVHARDIILSYKYFSNNVKTQREKIFIIIYYNNWQYAI